MGQSTHPSRTSAFGRLPFAFGAERSGDLINIKDREPKRQCPLPLASSWHLPLDAVTRPAAQFPHPRQLGPACREILDWHGFEMLDRHRVKSRPGMREIRNLSRVAPVFLLCACHRHYPGGTPGCTYRSLPQKWQPSPYLRRVGFRISFFEALQRSFALRPAHSPGLQPPRSLCDCSDCYRLERQFAGWGSHPLEDRALARRT